MTIKTKSFTSAYGKGWDGIFKKRNRWDENNVIDGVECPMIKGGKYETFKCSATGQVIDCYEPISKDCCLCKKYPCVG